MALREYPVLSTVMPLTENVATFALDKTGLPPLEKLDADYIAPALDHADVEYLDPAIAGLVGLHEKTTEKVVEIHTGVTTKTSEVYTGVSTRVRTEGRASLPTSQELRIWPPAWGDCTLGAWEPSVGYRAASAGRVPRTEKWGRGGHPRLWQRGRHLSGRCRPTTWSAGSRSAAGGRPAA